MLKRLMRWLERYTTSKSGAEMNNKRREEQIKFEDLCK
jgi:hypothetical protein